jgi:hypothetical protein
MGPTPPPGPYRSIAPAPPFRVAFGNPGRARLRILSGLALLAVSAIAILGWILRGGHVVGSVVMPALVGATLVARARWGTIEVSRERGVLSVAWRASVRQTLHELQLGDVESIDILPGSFRLQNPGYDLCLTLRDDRRVVLLRGTTEAELEPDRVAIANFLRAHGLPRRAADVGPESRVRIEQSPPAEEAEGESEERAMRR